MRPPLSSALVFGTLNLHNTPAPHALLTRAWNLGIKAYDCAAVYGGGECERIVGDWLRDPDTPEDARAGAQIITKGGCGPAVDGWAPRLDRASLEADLAASRDRLGRVDVYVLHRDDEARPVGEIVETMAALVGGGDDGGEACRWGVSNWSTERLGEALDYAESRGLPPPAISSVQAGLAVPRHAPWPGTVALDEKDRAWYADRGFPVLAWEPLAKGFLAGNACWDETVEHSTAPPDARDAPCDADSYVKWREGCLASAYGTRANRARRARCEALARARGVAPATIALAYCLHICAYVCVATTSETRLVENSAAAALTLSPADIAWLESGYLANLRSAAAAADGPPKCPQASCSPRDPALLKSV